MKRVILMLESKMRALRRFFKRMTWWATSQDNEERLRAEIEEHLDHLSEDYMRAGLSPDEARREASRTFGPVPSVKESYRDQRGLPRLEIVLQDTRHALRRLRLAPAFTIATVLTLALGIGATTSIFTLVNAILLKSLPVANPNQLYRLGKRSRCCYYGGYSQDQEFSLVSYQLYKHFRDHTKGFSELAAFSATNPLFGVRRTGSADPARSYPGEFVSGNYFAMFGVGAFAGRTFTAADDQPGAPPVAVMSAHLWQQGYGADPSVIGSVFSLNDRPFVVIGIAPPGFFGDTLRNNPPDLFLPLNTELLMDGDLNHYDTHWLELIGRVRPGAQPAAIESEMRVELKQWLRSHWGEMSANERAKFDEQTLFLSPGGAGIGSMREEYEHWLRILMLVTGFVLLIVCANVANLMLIRGLERRRQTSLSAALGARPSRILLQPLLESLLLAFFGGATGLALAFAGAKFIVHFAFPHVAGLAGVPISASPSVPVLLFAIAVSVVTGVAFGIGPAWMGTRVDPIEALRGASRTTGRGSFARRALVVCQAALSLVLLCAAGLFTAALHSLETQNFGFDPDRRIIAKIEPRLGGYGPAQLTLLSTRIRQALSAIPGVETAAPSLYSPFGDNNWGGGVWVDGHPPPGPKDEIFAFWDRVTPGYFDAIGTPILRGRGISERDTPNSPHVAVINQAFARKFFRNEDPIGKHFGQHGIGSEREYEIVGITKDARYLAFDLGKPVGPFFFLPEQQHDFGGPASSKDLNPGSHFLHDMVIVTRPGARVTAEQITQAFASVDPNLPIVSIRSLKQQVADHFIQQRLIARLASLFGILSLVLASIGLYGVTAYNAERRVGEIGVRMALGASRRDVIGMVLRGAFALIVVGLVVGLPLTFAVGRFLGSQLYGVSPYDPAVIVVAVFALGFSALAASFFPALRASLISPVEALRTE